MSSALSLQGKTGIYSPVEQAERENRVVRKWAENITPPTTNATILTNTAFNLPVNSVLYITELFTNIETFSDNCEFQIRKYTGQNGSGTGEDASAHVHLFSAVAGLGFTGLRENYSPAIVVKYSDGWRSVAIQVTAGDATTEITTAWAGYWEISAL